MKQGLIDDFFEGMHLKYLQRTQFRYVHRGCRRFVRDQRSYFESFYFYPLQQEPDASSFALYAAVSFKNLEEEYYPVTTWRGEPESSNFSHNHWVTAAQDLLANQEEACARFELRLDSDFDGLQREVAACMGLASNEMHSRISTIRHDYLQHYHHSPQKSF